MAYHLLIDLLRSLAGAAGAASEAETRAALSRLVAEALGGQASSVYPYLAHLLSLQLDAAASDRVQALDPQALQSQYLASLRQLLRALAARSPLVLIFDDVHWADPSSTDLLTRLLPLAGEAPLACEYRLVQPAVALIMLGTNDVPYTPDDEFDADMRRVIEFSLERGTLPVVSSLPPLFRTGLEGRAEQLNAILFRLAQEYQIPFWDFWASLQGLPNEGMAGDGVHPSWAPAGHNADFTPEYLQYGMVVRNLTALYVLDAVWRQVIQP